MLADGPTALRASLLIATVAIGLALVMVATPRTYGLTMLTGLAGLFLRYCRPSGRRIAR